jgi:septum formation protein
MPARRFVLASASPARLRLLRGAGLDPEVVVSHAEEGDVGHLTPEGQVLALAERKATAIAPQVGDALVLGCDSLLVVDGAARGKPASADEATAWWREVRGGSAVLLTGHHLVDAATGGAAGDVVATTVRFGTPSDAEIDAYVASGEPLAVAGAFTLDGRSAPFVDGVDGDPGSVIGLSLPLVRTLLARLDVGIVDLWA